MTPLPYQVEGFSDWLIRFWGRLLLKSVGVLAVGALVLVVVGSRLVPRSEDSTHSYGPRTVPLAPLGRRCLARGIDLALLLAPVFAQLTWIVYQSDADTLYRVLVDRFFQTNPLHSPELVLGYLIAACWAAILFLIVVRYEGRYGVTPGKWLCGIRTLRTTLRPCGFARALLRELLMWFDTPLLLTVIPGVMCLLCTDRRQRIGDLIADTIVVEHSRAEAA